MPRNTLQLVLQLTACCGDHMHICCRELARADSSVLVSPTTTALNASFGAQPPMTAWIMATVSSVYMLLYNMSLYITAVQGLLDIVLM